MDQYVCDLSVSCQPRFLSQEEGRLQSWMWFTCLRPRWNGWQHAVLRQGGMFQVVILTELCENGWLWFSGLEGSNTGRTCRNVSQTKPLNHGGAENVKGKDLRCQVGDSSMTLDGCTDGSAIKAPATSALVQPSVISYKIFINCSKIQTYITDYMYWVLLKLLLKPLHPLSYLSQSCISEIQNIPDGVRLCLKLVN